jgi:hypothetical protein
MVKRLMAILLAANIFVTVMQRVTTVVAWWYLLQYLRGRVYLGMEEGK